MKKVTEAESKKLATGICPDCGSKDFLEGPSATLAVNVQCAKCGSRFNICWPFTPERI